MRKRTAERVCRVADLLGRGAYKHEIKRWLRDRFGVGPRTAELLISKARDLIIERTGETKEWHRALAFSFYVSVIRDPDAPITLKIKAQCSINRLLGLNAPKGHRHAGAAALPLPALAEYVVVREREEAADLLSLASERPAA